MKESGKVIYQAINDGAKTTINSNKAKKKKVKTKAVKEKQRLVYPLIQNNINCNMYKFLSIFRSNNASA